jgi:hypothetical protein
VQADGTLKPMPEWNDHPLRVTLRW